MRYAALIAAVAVSAACSFDSDDGGLRGFTHESGWSIAYPDWIQVEQSGVTQRVGIDEVTFASFQPRKAFDSWSDGNSGGVALEPPSTARGLFPRDGIALRITRISGGPVWKGASPALSNFRLERFRHMPLMYDTSGVPAVQHTLRWNGALYQLRAWIGPKAPKGRRAGLAAMVQSLEFRRDD